MTRHPSFGVFLALFGALVITPDTLLMRWSAMGGTEMVAWRGSLMGLTLLTAWLLTARTRRADLGALIGGAGLLVVLCQFAGTTLFSVGIAVAPVSVILFSVSTVPVFAALLSRLLLGEPTHWSTWIAIVAVLAGIGIAVFGQPAGGVTGTPVLGAAAGLGVAVSLALNFVVLRRNPQVPILLAMGLGALAAGLAALARVTPDQMAAGHIWAILITGLVILPVSFFSLSLAARYTAAANVSLLMLLETILGPVWVWAGTGEALTPAMWLGGAIVIVSLALYVWHAGHRQASARRRARAAELVAAETAHL